MWLPLWTWIVLYAIGLTAAVYHFCNGIVTFCITWGITVGVTARRKMSIAAGGLGAILMIWGVLSLVALAQTPNKDSGPHSTATLRVVDSQAAPVSRP